jgi:hypothetical protein
MDQVLEHALVSMPQPIAWDPAQEEQAAKKGKDAESTPGVIAH